jgi:glycosyltransferase involved in cell wall biosynthesis
MADKKRLTVIQIVEDLKIGGLERYIQALAMNLPKERFNVKVWCLTKGGDVADELRAAGIEVETLDMGPRCSLRFLLALRRKLIAAGADILHSHGYPANVIGRAAGILARVPVKISHTHSTYWNYTDEHYFRLRLLALFTDKILCCSKAVADYVRDVQKVPPEKLAVVYNSASDMSLARDAGAKAGFGLAQDDFVVGVAASLVPNKGHDCFLEAMRLVIQEHPRAKGLLAGAGPLRGELEASAARLGIGGNIVFCGLVRRMGEFYSAADVLVQPSVYREGLSISILEAMSACIPVIGSDIGGIPEAVENGKSGILVPPNDPAALAAAIKRLIRDRSLAAGLGRAGRSAYEAKFTHAIMLSKVTGIYEELCR